MQSGIMATDDPGILGIVRPLCCGCQELLSTSEVTHHGWLRKKGLRNRLQNQLQLRLMNWPQMYAVIAGKCLYYFNNETSKKPSGSVSLYGFNRIIRANDVKTKEAPWAFRLEHIQPDMKALLFSASSERDMIKWMTRLKEEMLVANNIKHRSSIIPKNLSYSYDGMSEASSFSWDSSDYLTLESEISIESARVTNLQVPKRFSDEDVNESGDDAESGENFYDPVAHMGPAPPVPHRDGYEDTEVDDGEDFQKVKVHDERRFPPPLPPRDSREEDELMEGYSLQKPTTENSAVPEDAGSYWDSVHFGGDKAAASVLINSIADPGVFLIRKSEDGSSVLVVFADDNAKKYKVAEKPDGLLTLSMLNGPDFESLEQLLYYYYSNCLPNNKQMLSMPYKLHSNYSPKKE